MWRGRGKGGEIREEEMGDVTEIMGLVQSLVTILSCEKINSND